MTQSIWDLNKAYLPELLERFSVGDVLEADSNLSSHINFSLAICYGM